MDIVFSIVSSAVNEKHYRRCYNYLKQTSVPFEMICVGDNPPTEFVGENFKYIYSTVKPSQCVEIGARAAQGQYIIPTPDDYFFSENFLDELEKQMRTIDTNKYIVAFHYYPVCYEDELVLKYGGKKAPYDFRHFDIELGELGCFPKDLWHKLGGIDRRFIWAFPFADLILRCYEIGLTLKKPDHIYVQEIYDRLSPEEEAEYERTRPISAYGDFDYRVLSFFWNDAYGKFSKKRRLPVEPFEYQNLLTVSQSESGKWS